MSAAHRAEELGRARADLALLMRQLPPEGAALIAQPSLRRLMNAIDAVQGRIDRITARLLPVTNPEKPA